MEYMLSKAGKQLVVIDEYKFGFHKNLSGGIKRWKCSKRGCTAFIKVLNEVIVEQNLYHDHAADTTLARQKITNLLKRKASDALRERPTKIIRCELASSGMSDVVTTDDMNRFRKNLSAAKLRKFPKLPTTVLELIPLASGSNLQMEGGSLNEQTGADADTSVRPADHPETGKTPVAKQ